MINFEVKESSVQKALIRIEKARTLKKRLDICIEGGICPLCSGDLEKVIDSGRNISHKCTGDYCDFIWPPPPEKVKFYAKKNIPKAKTSSSPKNKSIKMINPSLERLG